MVIFAVIVCVCFVKPQILMRRLIVHIFCLTISLSLFAEQRLIGGSWSGKLELGNGRHLRLVFHILEDGKGITMDSPDQGVKGIPLDVQYLSSDSLNCSKSAMMLSFSGRLENERLSGTFFQRGLTIPLTLNRVTEKVNRPQTPLPPYPYSEESVLITNDSVILSGTLTLPEEVNAYTPVVLMITGSGLQNSDEELFEHRPFAVIADYLARRGIASLRYDDSGFGESTGNVANATTADFAEDAKMALDWLRNTGRFGKIGIIGHSEGGQIAYMLGAEKSADYIISIAGPSILGFQTIAFQNKIALLKSGIDETTAEDFAVAIEKAFNYKLTHTHPILVNDTLIAELYPQFKDNALTARLAESLR